LDCAAARKAVIRQHITEKNVHVSRKGPVFFVSRRRDLFTGNRTTTEKQKACWQDELCGLS
jgi:hypothetical protein